MEDRSGIDRVLRVDTTARRHPDSPNQQELLLRCAPVMLESVNNSLWYLSPKVEEPEYYLQGYKMIYPDRQPIDPANCKSSMAVCIDRVEWGASSYLNSTPQLDPLHCKKSKASPDPSEANQAMQASFALAPV